MLSDWDRRRDVTKAPDGQNEQQWHFATLHSDPLSHKHAEGAYGPPEKPAPTTNPRTHPKSNAQEGLRCDSRLFSSLLRHLCRLTVSQSIPTSADSISRWVSEPDHQETLIAESMQWTALYTLEYARRSNGVNLLEAVKNCWIKVASDNDATAVVPLLTCTAIYWRASGFRCVWNLGFYWNHKIALIKLSGNPIEIQSEATGKLKRFLIKNNIVLSLNATKYRIVIIISLDTRVHGDF